MSKMPTGGISYGTFYNQTVSIQNSNSKSYANSSQINDLIKQLTYILPLAIINNISASRGKLIRHIRITKASTNDVLTALKTLQFQQTEIDTTQKSVSSTYIALSFKKANDTILYTFVIGTKGNGIGFSKKELTPSKLGIACANKKYTKLELITSVKNSVNSYVQQENYKALLTELVDIASNGGNGYLSSYTLKKSLMEVNNYVNQDFGEILTPIVLMGHNDTVEFPIGNNPLTDAVISGVNYSIKSLTGSGTSFRSISNLMDKFENDITVSYEQKKLYEPLKQFHPSAGGSNLDKIIRASQVANVNEFKAITATFNIDTTTVLTFDKLTTSLSYELKNIDYPEFLKIIEPASMAGNWKPHKSTTQPLKLGMPKDSAYYLGHTNVFPSKDKLVAGKRSYENDKFKSAANIIVYMLGKGLEYSIQYGSNAVQYENLMTDIVSKADSTLAHININSDGYMNIKTTPFNSLKFKFQYHAPSHIAGNNLPGFAAILP